MSNVQGWDPHVRRGGTHMSGVTGWVPHVRRGGSHMSGGKGRVPHVRRGGTRMSGVTGRDPHVRRYGAGPTCQAGPTCHDSLLSGPTRHTYGSHRSGWSWSQCVLLVTMGPTVKISQQVNICFSCQWVPPVNEFKTITEQ